MSKGLQRNQLVFEDWRAWTRLMFLRVSSGGCEGEARLCAEMSQAMGTTHLHVPREWQRTDLGLCRAVLSEPLYTQHTVRSHTTESHPQTQQYLYLAGLPTLLVHCDFVEAVNSDCLKTN